jgi:putative transposase
VRDIINISKNNQKKYNIIKKSYQINNDDNFNIHFNKILIINKLIICGFNNYYKYNNQDYIEDINNLINHIKDNNCVPFWNSQTKKISEQIFLPTKKNIFKIKNPNIFNNTWFNTEYYLKTFKYKNFDDMNIEENKINNFNLSTVKCSKIKIYFNSKQKEAFKKIIGGYRYYYNRAVQYINNFDKNTNITSYKINIKDDKSIYINLADIKNKFSYITIRKYIKDNKPLWLDINLPSHLIDKAFMEAAQNYSKCLKMYSKNHIYFKLKPKTKKDKYQTINIEKTMISSNKTGIFPNLKYNNEYVFKNIKFSEPLKNKFLDSSITLNVRLNEYYLNLNYNTVSEEININKVCSIDPGMKTFLTVYSDMSVVKLGNNINTKIGKICYETDIINSKISDKNRSSNSRRNLRKALHRKIKYLENLKDELHNKCIRFLINNYSVIILPPFEIQKMAGRKSRKFSRNLYNLSFYKFKKKLENKCIELNIKLINKPEYYTSKICTRCGNIKHNLTLDDRIYECKKCNLVIDRDINAARNIMLRNYLM